MLPTNSLADHYLFLFMWIVVVAGTIANIVISVLAYRRMRQLKRQREEAYEWFTEQIKNRNQTKKGGNHDGGDQPAHTTQNS